MTVRFSIAVLALVAFSCGTAPEKQPDEFPPVTNPAPDSGVVPDAGVNDDRPAGCQPTAAFDCQATTLTEKLSCIKGLTFLEVPDSGVPGYRRFNMSIAQPADHFAKSDKQFQQRLVLWHRDEAAPTVLFTTGYQLGRGLSEPTRTLAANQITYEHRFFESSTPDDQAAETLTIKQAAADAHRIVELLRPLYRARWLNTGGSKGGMTSVFHRRFYPCDVDATVAYVAPIAEGLNDPAYSEFLKTVGGTEYVTCRDDIVKAQRSALTRRDELLPLIPATLTFSALGKETAFEFAVVDTFFAFWQYTDPRNPSAGCTSVPKPDAPADELFAFIDRHGTLSNNSDADLKSYRGYWIGAAKELGFPTSNLQTLSDLLKFEKDYTSASYAQGTYVYDPAPQNDVTQWVKREATQMLFIYGEFDPWSARIYDPDSTKDNLRLFVAKGNHSARIAQLAPNDQAAALQSLDRWMNVKRAPAPGSPKMTVPQWLELDDETARPKR
jgi:hypothetical protein